MVFGGLLSIALVLGLFLAVTRVHKRKFMTLVSPDATINWLRVLQGFIVWLGLRGVSFFVWYLISPSLFSLTFNLSEWLPFAFVALIFVPIMSLAVNIFILGYLLQGSGLLIRHPLLLPIVWGFVVGGLGSIGNSPEYWIRGVFYVVFLAWLVIKDNRLELALGLQTAEQLYSLIFISSPNPAIEGPTVFNIFDSADLFLPALATIALRAGLFYFIFFGRRKNLSTSIPD
ncbi:MULTISPECIES: hypothetical protein [Trichocoleus]|uniref:Uncharacterized protein n=1 Tax=Trichocoleus desertorum GB2-A4 TaxID=2933944 RepID=A0ABV0JH73_9CYAN|nr:hypothetical protein [Trichocoleus sp. FACHB-46]